MIHLSKKPVETGGCEKNSPTPRSLPVILCLFIRLIYLFVYFPSTLLLQQLWVAYKIVRNI